MKIDRCFELDGVHRMLAGLVGFLRQAQDPHGATLEQGGTAFELECQRTEELQVTTGVALLVPSGRAFRGAAGYVGNDGWKSRNGLDHVGTTRIDLGGDFLCNFVEALDQCRQVQVIQRFAQKHCIGCQFQAVDGEQDQFGQ